MKTHDFYYDLPPELIAQTPIERRDASRLMALDKETGKWEHRHFFELPSLLRPGDCLIMNDSRVLPARLLGSRVRADGTLGGACEALLLIDRGDNVWECLVRPGKKLRAGAKVSFGEAGELTGEIVGEVEGGNRLVRFAYQGIFLEVLERLGKMPLPPYIKAELQDRERYQTVYSRVTGSAAAPTAGLHFTKELMEEVRAMGVNIGYVTLHVGLGTFRPVKEEEITDHDMHSEYCVVPQETADLINRTKAAGDLRGHHLLPDDRELGGGGRTHEGQGRVDQHLYLSRLPVQGDGRAHHQLPSAGEHPYHAGVRPGGAGACAGGLRGGGQGAVSVFLLWGCDVHRRRNRMTGGGTCLWNTEQTTGSSRPPCS